MRSIILLSIILFTNQLLAQNVSINDTGAAPDDSAMLDVQSTNKGMLLPRMNTMQRLGILQPVNSLLVFDSDKEAYTSFIGNNWVDIATTNQIVWSSSSTNIFNLNPENVGIGISNPREKLQVNGNIEFQGDLKYANTGGILRLMTASNNINNGNFIVPLAIDNDTGNVGIGIETPSASLEVNGQIKINGGSPGPGKILTSDGDGLSTWQNPPMTLPSNIPNQLSNPSINNFNIVGAHNYCRNLTEDGHSDWYLPTHEELAFFIGTVTDGGNFYWTRTAILTENVSGKWLLVRTEDGDTINDQHTTGSRQCRCVR